MCVCVAGVHVHNNNNNNNVQSIGTACNAAVVDSTDARVGQYIMVGPSKTLRSRPIPWRDSSLPAGGTLKNDRRSRDTSPVRLLHPMKRFGRSKEDCTMIGECNLSEPTISWVTAAVAVAVSAKNGTVGNASFSSPSRR